jgi:hypothetical protein
MVNTFKYSTNRRMFAILIIPLMSIFSYGFFREAFPIENYLFSILCIIVSTLFAAITIRTLNASFVKIIVNEKGISIKKIYNSYSANWEDVIEYGRDRVMAYGCYIWRYYIRITGHGDKKCEICREGLKELRRLSAHIIIKSKNAKFNNVGPGMIM